MATLTVGTIKTQLGWTYEDDSESIAETTNSGNLPYSTTLTSGTAEDKADKIYFVAGTLAASGTTTFNLSTGGTDVFGVQSAFARIKVMMIKNKTSSAITGAVINVGAAASNPFVTWVGNTDDVVNVRPEGVLFLAAPDATAYAVGSGVNLKLVNASSATTVSWDLVLIGASA